MPRSIYYTRREPPQASEFEEGYWGVVKDPDGNVRDLSAERDKKVTDLACELAFVNKLPPGRLLDVGCGLGHLLSGVDPRWERHGIEISAYAAEKAEEYGTIFHGDLMSAGYPDAFFDVVTLYHVIEHMEDPESELREIRRVLKPGGWLIAGTPNFDSACARRFGDKFRLLHDVTHISLFSAESLRRLLEDNGFSVDWEDYPFFDTRYFTRENLERLFDTTQMSPPFYGNIMTLYARLPDRSSSADTLALAGRAAWRLANDAAVELDRVERLIQRAAERGGDPLRPRRVGMPARRCPARRRKALHRGGVEAPRFRERWQTSFWSSATTRRPAAWSWTPAAAVWPSSASVAKAWRPKPTWRSRSRRSILAACASRTTSSS